MAEPVSGIITIATVSLAIIKETINFIQEARVIDQYIERLLVNLVDLHKLIREVESACRHARTRDDDPSRFVHEHLKRCRRRLEEVQTTVKGLASRKSGNLLQRAALKIRSDRSQKEIEDAITDIERLMDQIHKGISCWTLHMTSVIDRRTSEVIFSQQVTAIRTGLQEIMEDPAIQPFDRTLSQVETLYEHDFASPRRRTSSATTGTQRSFSSASSRPFRAGSLDTRSVASNHDSSPVKPKNNWVDFHFQIAKCKGSEARIQDIRTILQQHADGSALATSTDAAQRTPLHLAAQRGDARLARILLDFGANINAKDSEPSTVLDLAIANNQRDFVAFLLDRGVDEKAILSRNVKKFKEMKSIISFSKNLPKSASKKETRKSSRGTRQSLSA